MFSAKDPFFFVAKIFLCDKLVFVVLVSNTTYANEHSARCVDLLRRSCEAQYFFFLDKDVWDT